MKLNDENWYGINYNKAMMNNCDKKEEFCFKILFDR